MAGFQVSINGRFRVSTEALGFEVIGPPTDSELETLLQMVRTQVLALCGENDTEPDDDTQLLAALGGLAKRPKCSLRRPHQGHIWLR